jgi:hypothetical protein
MYYRNPIKIMCTTQLNDGIFRWASTPQLHLWLSSITTTFFKKELSRVIEEIS